MDENVVDTLKIEIEADSSAAIGGLEKLIDVLGKIKSSIKGVTSEKLNISGLKEAISTTTKIEEATQKATQAADKLGDTFSEINADDLISNTSNLDLLQMKINGAKNKLQELLNQGETDSPAVARLVEQVRSLQAQLDETTQSAAETNSELDGVTEVEEGNASERVSRLSEFLSGLKDRIKSVNISGGKFASVLKGVGIAASVAGRLISGVGRAAFSAGQMIAKVAGAPFRKLGESVKSIGHRFGNLTAMFKKRVLYRLMNALISFVTKSVREGISNVYQYSKAFGGTFSQSMDRAATSMLYFKNSIGAMIAPLINMLVPALEWVIGKVVDFVNVLNQLFAKLSGASTWTRALMYPKEYAEATNQATEANKKFKASILGIDELNVMQDNSSPASGGNNSGDDYSKMFEEVALDGQSIFGDFFKPLKEAWENEGMATVNAIKRMFASIGALFGAIGRSFNEVWQNGTGQQTCETILRITQNIANFWANIADSIRRAWEANGTGTRIIQAVWDILNSILGTFERITAATAEWARSLNFTPLLEAIAHLFERLKPLIDLIGQAIEWIWTNIVLPIGTWLIESALPDVINALSGLIDFLTGVFTGDWELAWQGICDFVSNIWELIWTDTLYPIVMWVYDNILVPIGQFFTDTWNTIRDTVVGVWDAICLAWEVAATWFDTNIIQPIAGFFSGLWGGISTTASDCWNAIVEFFSPAIEWFSELFEGIWRTISDIFYNIGVIASGCWEIIKRAWEVASSWFNEKVIQPVSNFFANLWNGIKSMAVSAWNGIKTFLAPIVNWFNDKIIKPLSTFFTNLWNGFKEKAKLAWEGIKSVFSKVADFFKDTFKRAWEGIVHVFSIAGEIFVDIKDGVVAAFKWVVNGIIGGINKVVAIPFGAINGVLGWLRDINIFGLRPFDGIQLINVPQIPLLAEGGIVNAGTMFIAGEAGAEVVAQVGNRTGVMNTDEMRDSVAQGVMDANAEQNALLREEVGLLRKILEKDVSVNAYVSTGDLISGMNRKNRRDGKTILPVGV